MATKRRRTSKETAQKNLLIKHSRAIAKAQKARAQFDAALVGVRAIEVDLIRRGVDLAPIPMSW